MKRSRVFVEYVTIYRTIVHEKDAYEQIELTADVLKKFFIKSRVAAIAGRPGGVSGYTRAWYGSVSFVSSNSPECILE